MLDDTSRLPIISADSHITEPPDTYVDYIDPAYRDRAPQIVDQGDELGDVFVIDGMSSADLARRPPRPRGKPPDEIRRTGDRFEELHRGGWDPTARLADQDRDGVAAEVIYPTVGMVLCNHPDLDYKQACFEAYNRWIAEYCACAPDRLLGLGQTAMRTPEEGIADLQHDQGARAARRDDARASPVSRTTTRRSTTTSGRPRSSSGCRSSFHILTTRAEQDTRPQDEPFLSIVRGCQDIMGDARARRRVRAPPEPARSCASKPTPAGCRTSCTGWTTPTSATATGCPRARSSSKLPSEYFAENIYVTFQDDWTAFQHADDMNWHHLLWANDFPHSDSTWPWSQEMLAEHTASLSDEQTDAILAGNVSQLYRIDTASLV